MKKHIDDNCIFCKLANGQIPTNSIYEDDDFKVILDAAPAAKDTPSYFQKHMQQTSLNSLRNTVKKYLP